SSQSLWNRLSVLLNLLPSAGDLQDSDGLSPLPQSVVRICCIPSFSAISSPPGSILQYNRWASSSA
ncbi:hypothetical protein E2320_013676, partial [Naja naja]